MIDHDLHLVEAKYTVITIDICHLVCKEYHNIVDRLTERAPTYIEEKNRSQQLGIHCDEI